eukprot:m.215661 g.215661  ORF g.215661 m.215661 type:complete len:1380 (+) comp19109_c0_seq1:169-4308(+)
MVELSKPVARLTGYLRGADGLHPLSRSRKTIIGRGPESDIVIPGRGANREHATIVYDIENDRFFLDDKNSINGTFLNDVKISEASPLHQYDFVRFGTSKCTFRFERESIRPQNEHLRGAVEGGRTSRDSLSKQGDAEYGGNTSGEKYGGNQQPLSPSRSTRPDVDVLTDDSLDDDISGSPTVHRSGSHHRSRRHRHTRHPPSPVGRSSGSDDGHRHRSAPQATRQRGSYTSRSRIRPATAAHPEHRRSPTSVRFAGKHNDEWIDNAQTQRLRSSVRHRTPPGHTPSSHRPRSVNARKFQRASGVAALRHTPDGHPHGTRMFPEQQPTPPPSRRSPARASGNTGNTFSVLYPPEGNTATTTLPGGGGATSAQAIGQHTHTHTLEHRPHRHGSVHAHNTVLATRHRRDGASSASQKPVAFDLVFSDEDNAHPLSSTGGRWGSPDPLFGAPDLTDVLAEVRHAVREGVRAEREAHHRRVDAGGNNDDVVPVVPRTLPRRVSHEGQGTGSMSKTPSTPHLPQWANKLLFLLDGQIGAADRHVQECIERLQSSYSAVDLPPARNLHEVFTMTPEMLAAGTADVPREARENKVFDVDGESISTCAHVFDRLRLAAYKLQALASSLEALPWELRDAIAVQRHAERAEVEASLSQTLEQQQSVVQKEADGTISDLQQKLVNMQAAHAQFLAGLESAHQQAQAEQEGARNREMTRLQSANRKDLEDLEATHQRESDIVAARLDDCDAKLVEKDALVDKLTAELHRVQAESSAVDAQRAKERMDMERIASDLAQSRRSERESADEVRRLEVDVEDAKRSATAALDELAQSRATAEHLRCALDEATAAKRELQTQCESAQHDLTRLETVVEEATTQPAALRAELASIKSDFDELTAVCDEAKSEAAQLRADLETATSASDAHRSELQKCAGELEKMQASLAQARNVSKETADHLQQARLDAARLETDLEQARQRCTAVEHDNATLAASAAQANESVERLTARVHALEATHKGCAARESQLQTDVAARDATCASLTAEVERVRHEFDAQSSALAAATTAHARAVEETQALQDSLVVATADATRLDSAVRAGEQHTAALTADLADQTAAVERLQATVTEHRAAADAVHAQLATAVQDRDALQGEVARLQERLDLEARDVADAHAKAMAAAEARLQELEKEVSAGVAERQQLEDTVADAHRTANELRARVERDARDADDRLAKESADAIAKILADEAGRRDALAREHADRNAEHTRQRSADQRRIAVLTDEVATLKRRLAQLEQHDWGGVTAARRWRQDGHAAAANDPAPNRPAGAPSATPTHVDADGVAATVSGQEPTALSAQTTVQKDPAQTAPAVPPSNGKRQESTPSNEPPRMPTSRIPKSTSTTKPAS